MQMISWLLKKRVEYLKSRAARWKHNSQDCRAGRCLEDCDFAFRRYQQFFYLYHRWLNIYEDYQLKRRTQKCR